MSPSVLSEPSLEITRRTDIESMRNFALQDVESGHGGIANQKVVGPCGLEPQTSTVSRWRSSQLSYGPTDAESISYAALILSHSRRGAQFGSHSSELLPEGSQNSLSR